MWAWSSVKGPPPAWALQLNWKSGLWVVLWAVPLLAQQGTGQLRLTVRDATGLGVEASGELVSQANQVRQTFHTDSEGKYGAKDLPFGLYLLRVERSGFAPFFTLLEIRSELPRDYQVTLGVAPLEATVLVADSATLLDPYRTGPVFRLGPETLRDRQSMQPSRALLELVQTQPGWLLEANGVLHPRGSEYATQYVIDGFPITDNRSPAFAPALEVEQLRSLNVLTANYPAEYGRKLGGVIEAVTTRNAGPGFHGKAVLQAGSFLTQSSYISGQYVRGRTAVAFGVQGGRTDRYLDPPVEGNFTNKAYNSGISGRFERDWSQQSRLRLSLYRQRTGLLVPNEEFQQQAGQRQDRRNAETLGQLSYQRTLSPRLLASFRGMGRDLSANLWSNSLSTPILAGQQRGLREGYGSTSLSAHLGNHELKTGVEAIWSSVRERFGYEIVDQQFFDAGTPPEFRFADRRAGREQSLFVQDLIRAGHWTFSAGLRWDRYRLLVRDNAFSPRLGVAWYWPRAELVLRASYDRAFQIPATENLLLASSESAQRLTEQTTALPVPPSRGNFYQAGFAKSVFGKLRLDGNYFRREIRNFADDDVFLNTGVSFPIAFSRAQVYGFEGKLEVPRWGPVSGFLSYAHLVGTGFLPIAGGLFLEQDSGELRSATGRFPISQDQRHTAQVRVRYQIGPRVWAAVGARYGSGLPIEQEEPLEEEKLEERFGQGILRRVNLARGRVRPSFSLDTSLGVDLWSRDNRSVRLQLDVLNLTNRLNVINFAGLFSGTALAPPRSVALRLRTDF